MKRRVKLYIIVLQGELPEGYMELKDEEESEIPPPKLSDEGVDYSSSIQFFGLYQEHLYFLALLLSWFVFLYSSLNRFMHLPTPFPFYASPHPPSRFIYLHRPFVVLCISPPPSRLMHLPSFPFYV